MDLSEFGLFHGANINNRDFYSTNSYLAEGKFGWLYRNIQPWQPAKKNELVDLAMAMIPKGANRRSHGTMPAGYTYFAQLIDHDLTFDPSSLSQQIDDPELLYNYRTPAFDLDCLYGRGPRAEPYLYAEAEPAKFRIDEIPTGEQDFPRIGDRAIVADSRNDDLILLSQLSVGMMAFHNHIVDQLSKQKPFNSQENARTRNAELFYSARKIVRWHYQWVVLHDFLSRILHPQVHSRLFDRVLSHLKSENQAPLLHFRPHNSPYLPIEFTAAAFRFAHCLPRASYVLNQRLADELKDAALQFRASLSQRDLALLDRNQKAADDVEHSRLCILLQNLEAGAVPTFFSTEEVIFAGKPVKILGNVHPDLRGRRKLPPNWHIDWKLFLSPSSAQDAQTAMQIETLMSAPLSLIPRGAQTFSLAKLDLEKGLHYKLPSGQTLARKMGLTANEILSKADFPEEIPAHSRIDTPLWYYILREAQVQQGSARLGILGSEIIGEVLVGLMMMDSTSFLNEDPGWKPGGHGNFTLLDLLSLNLP